MDGDFLETGMLGLPSDGSMLSLFLGIMSLQQAEANWNLFGDYFIYFVVGLVAGALITLVISNYFTQRKVRTLSSQLDRLTKSQQLESVRSPDARPNDIKSAKDITSSQSDKMLSLHEKEIESLARLASTLSHDLNNLVGSIMGYASLLMKRLPPGTKEFHYSEIIENSSKQISQLVKRVLGFSQLDTKTMKVVDLNQFVKIVSEEFSSVKGEKYNVTVSVDPRPAPVRISVDQLNQVLLAVLDNAADSMKAGGTIESSIHVSEKPGEQTQCLLEIEDHGTGMSEEIQRKIFEPFFTTKSDRRYTGLSLSQVFNIVKQHNGTISVDSVVGVGTKVRLYFPLYQEEMGPASQEAISQDLELKGVKILIVDDEENVRQLGFDILTERGFHVITANDGLDALRKVKEYPDIRLVILDMIMPVMTGKDACIEIKKMEHPPKILICTGFSELSDLKTILGTYAEGLIQKPYSTSELVAAVGNLLRDTA